MAASKSRSGASSRSSGSTSRRGAPGAAAATSRRSSAAGGRGAAARSTGGAARGAEPRITTDHEEIRRWAEARGGRPACVRGTERGDSCLLRIDFPGGAGAERLKPLDWDTFFEEFDRQGLVFLYQDRTASGRTSRFNKFVSRETAQELATRRRARSRSRSRAGRDAR
jgi:hypothetical protein